MSDAPLLPIFAIFITIFAIITPTVCRYHTHFCRPSYWSQLTGLHAMHPHWLIYNTV